MDSTPGPADRPETAMDTGSDAGAPGDHLAEPPLTEDEQATLAAFRADAGGSPVAAVEDSPAAAEAAGDDSPLPDLGPGGDEGDADTPVFRAATDQD